MRQISTTTKKLKKNAREILFKNYSALLLSTLFFIALGTGFTYLSNCFASLLYGFTSDSTVILVATSFMIISVIFCVPLFFGYISVIADLRRGESFVLSNLFLFYSSSEKAKQAYACSLIAVPELICGIGLPLVVYYRLSSVIDKFDFNPFGSLTVLIAATFIAALIGFVFSGKALRRIFHTAFEKDQDKKISFLKFTKFRLSFIPLVLISLLSFGILFIVYTIPYILVSYYIYLCPNKCETKECSISLDEIPDYGSSSDTAVFDIPFENGQQ